MKNWEECNKPHVLSKQFFDKQGIKVFVSGRPSKEFFAVYNFFKKMDETVLNLLHEFLSTHNFSRKITMNELFLVAERWNTKTKVAVVTETQKKNYMEALQKL